MIGTIWYCPNCLYRVDLNNQDPEYHKKKFDCENFEIEPLSISNESWMWGIFEQLDEAENFLIGESRGYLLGT